MRDLLGAFGIALPDPRALAERMRQTIQRGLDIAGRQHVTTHLNIGDAVGATGEDIGKIPGIGAAAGIGEKLGEDISEGMEKTLERGARSAMESLLRGLMEGRDNILDAVLRVGQSIAASLATDGIMSELGIESPSRVARQIGEQVGLGLIQGIRRMENVAAQAGRNLAASTVGGMQATARQGGGASAVRRTGASQGGGNIRSKVEVNINAIDRRGIEQMLEENRGKLVDVVARGFNESMAARRAAFG